MIIRIRWRRQDHSPWEQLRRGARRFFFAAGSLSLGYCGFAYLEGALYQARESARLDELLLPPTKTETGNHSPRGIQTGSTFARLEIPRLGISVIVSEGVTAHNLSRAAGHIPGTPFPGESGNAGLAAHRDTYFRNLGKIQSGDAVVLIATYGTFHYLVETTEVVKASDMRVLDDAGSPSLTLITCYPFYYVGPAPKRFIVRARQVSSD